MSLSGGGLNDNYINLYAILKQREAQSIGQHNSSGSESEVYSLCSTQSTVYYNNIIMLIVWDIIVAQV